MNTDACATNCTLHQHQTPRGKDDTECAVIDVDDTTPQDELFATLEHVLACDGVARVRTRLQMQAELVALSTALRERFAIGDAVCIWFEELAGAHSGDALIVIDYSSLDSDTELDTHTATTETQ